jgi:ribosomal protein L24E
MELVCKYCGEKLTAGNGFFLGKSHQKCSVSKHKKHIGVNVEKMICKYCGAAVKQGADKLSGGNNGTICNASPNNMHELALSIGLGNVLICKYCGDQLRSTGAELHGKSHVINCPMSPLSPSGKHELD